MIRRHQAYAVASFSWETAPRCQKGMNHWPACHVCKTAYISAVNRMRCESSTESATHQLRDPKQGLYQPCLIPGMTECGKWSRLKRWWDDLPTSEAVKLLQGSTRFGNFYLKLEGQVLEQLLAAGCSDVDTLARHPLVLQSTPDQAPSTAYVVAAGIPSFIASVLYKNLSQLTLSLKPFGPNKFSYRARDCGCKFNM